MLPGSVEPGLSFPTPPDSEDPPFPSVQPFDSYGRSCVKDHPSMHDLDKRIDPDVKRLADDAHTPSGNLFPTAHRSVADAFSWISVRRSAGVGPSRDLSPPNVKCDELSMGRIVVNCTSAAQVSYGRSWPSAYFEAVLPSGLFLVMAAGLIPSLALVTIHRAQICRLKSTTYTPAANVRA